MSAKLILIAFSLLCFLAAVLDFYPSRTTAAGLFLLSLSFLLG